jgi:hypothetical protein
MAKSRGIYFRFEAEYHDDSDVHPGGDLSGTMIYMSPSENSARVGYSNIDEDSSNHHYWQIENGIAGYAYRDIQFKNQVLASDSYPHAGREFLFPLNNAGSEYQHNSNKLHVTFALRCYLLEDLPDTTVIAIISFKSGDVINNKQNLIPHYTSETDSTEFTYLTKAMYQAAPIDAVHQNRLVSVSIPVKSLYYRNAVRYTREGLLPMVNLNPNLYWKGMGVLKLDYIDYRDDWYKKYKYRDALQQ